MSYEEVRYEGYGPGGIAVMVDCLTDNRNRTVAEVRHAFSKFGGNLGADGSVAYLFAQTGLLSYTSGQDPDKLMEAAIEAGADDVIANDDGSADVLCEPAEFDSVQAAMTAQGLAPDHAQVTMHANVQTPVRARQAESLLKLLDALDELDDVQQVYSNGIYPPSCSRRPHERFGPHPRHRPGFEADRLRNHRHPGFGQRNQGGLRGNHSDQG